jgi:hypothetical protein
MIRKILVLATLVTLPFMGAGSAQAQSYGHQDNCREYTKDVSINGRIERAYGTACRQPDGSWEVVNLEGDYNARDEVHDAMYNDIQKYETRRVNNRVVERIIVVDNYRFDRPHYRERYNRYAKAKYNKHHGHRYHRASYNSWPFVINWNVGNSRYYKNNNKRYNSKSYNRHYKNARYTHRRY